MMNSGLRRLLSGAVALMLLGCSSALADTATVTARKLILREKASSTSDALQTLPKGTKLEILGKSGSWYKVTYGKYTGYVYKTYVSVTKTASSSSSSSSTTRLEKGSTGSDVKDLQTKLKKLGYYDAYVDGDYGDTTAAAVKAFQKKYNLTADGIAGKETLKKLDSVYENANSAKDDDSLRMGDSGSAVKNLQTKLKKLGYYNGTVDSTFGSGTYAAVRAFQQKNGLTADGVAGSETLKKLDSAYKNADSDKDDDSLRKGATGSAVKDLQTKLKKLGFYNAYVDGSYGDTTVAAVKAFQKKYNLTADGVAGSETLKKLDSAYKNADSNTSTDDDSLRKGATGTAVKTLQTNLKKLGFYTAYVDGSFGATTESAVKAFQRKYGLTADGVAGSETLKKLDSAYKNADSNTSTDDDSLRKGATGTAVKTLQTNLKKLGFYTAYVDGSFGATTESAVKAFQRKYGLTADGVAGSATLKKIESAVASANSGKITTERLDWFNGGKNVIPNGAVFQIKDVSTGLIFSARRQSGGSHMDAEPLTAEDTAILKKINGGTFSWRRRAVLVKYNGHVYAASIYSEPHGTNTILDNNFDGQFCLHFYGSKTHGTNRVDADHQKCVEQAMKATW